MAGESCGMGRTGPPTVSSSRPALTSCSRVVESEVLEVDRDHQQIADGFQVRRAHVGTTLRGKSHPVDRDNVSDILRDGKSAGDIDVIIVSPQDAVLAEVKVLLLAVTGDRVGKLHPQAAPALRTFLPGRDLRDFEAGH